MSLFDDPRVIEASLAAVGTTTIGCTCRWDEDGNPPPDCTCAERSRAYATDRRRAALNAALAALPREEVIETGRAALERASQASYSWEDLARAVAVAIGLIPEHVTPTDDGSHE